MSEKTFEPAEWPLAKKMAKFIEESDAKLVELEAALELHREQTVAAFKEMGFDFDKVKVRARVPQTDKPNAVDNARHLGPSADPIDWSAPVEPSIDASSTQQGDELGTSATDQKTTQPYKGNLITRLIVPNFTPNAGASVDGDPKQTTIKKYVSPVRSSDKAQRASGIISAGGSTPEGDADGFYTDTDRS